MFIPIPIILFVTIIIKPKEKMTLYIFMPVKREL